MFPFDDVIMLITLQIMGQYLFEIIPKFRCFNENTKQNKKEKHKHTKNKITPKTKQLQLTQNKTALRIIVCDLTVNL